MLKCDTQYNHKVYKSVTCALMYQGIKVFLNVNLCTNDIIDIHTNPSM